MAIVQKKEGGGMCHFTRQGLGLLLYLNNVKAKSPNSLQPLALPHISILASRPATEADIVWVAGQQGWVTGSHGYKKEEWKVVSYLNLCEILEVSEYK